MSTDKLANKYNRIIGTVILIIAVIIIAVSVTLRYRACDKASGYEYTDGTITETKEIKTYPFGGYGRPNYDYRIHVEFTPEGQERPITFIDYSHEYEFLYAGDTVRIYYMADDPHEAFVARKDWLTKSYIPQESNYDIPLVIAGVIIIIGVFFFIDDSKLRRKL